MLVALRLSSALGAAVTTAVAMHICYCGPQPEPEPEPGPEPEREPPEEPDLLWQAADEGATDLVAALLANGDSEIEWQHPHMGTTALHRATFGGHTETAKLLVEAGADLNALSRCGATTCSPSSGARCAATCHRRTSPFCISRSAARASR